MSRAPFVKVLMMQPSDILDAKVIGLSAKDWLLFRQMTQGGTLISGRLGSGKSSTSLKQLIYGLLRLGVGGLFCTTKPEDTENYIAYAKACGREKDIILFNIENDLTFDPLAYLWQNGRGKGDVEAIIDFFGTLLSLGKQHLGINNDRFWELASEQAMRHAIHLINLSNEPLSITSIYRAIQSFPSRPGEHEEKAWQDTSYTASLIDSIRRRKDSLTETQWKDLTVATEFVFGKWASYDEKPRSSIEMTFAGMADKFLFSPFREKFCSGTYSFSPEQATHEHKLIILDTPVLACGRETARLIQILIKLVFQRAWLRHSYQPGCCHGAVLVQDEFQMLISRFENHFVQVCRSSAIAPIFITQTILNLAEEMGESQPGSKTNAFLNNLSIKIAHSSTCPDTCEYLSRVIGREYTYLENFNAGSSGLGQTHTSVGGSRHLAHIVEPIEFTRLLTPDGENPNAEAIVTVGGAIFKATVTPRKPQGSNFIRVLFSREI
jgi:hypothetical protein